MGDCCACCKLHPYYIHWDMDVQSQSATERLAQRLSEPWELEKEGMAVKMPFNKMEREIPDGIETSAGVVKTTHTIHLTMRNSATNKVEAGKAIVAPEASISEIIKFESHVQSWKTNGYTRSVPLFGGGGFFMAPSSSGAPPQFDLKGIFPFLA